MKKLLFIAMLFAGSQLASAQNYDTLYIQDVENYGQYHYCADTYDGVVIYGNPDWNCQWRIGINGAIGDLFYADYIIIPNSEPQYQINYIGGGSKIFYIFFHAPLEASPFSEPVLWKRPNETVTLTIEGGNFDPYYYEYLWSNGSTEWSIEITQLGTYSVTITSLYGCGSQTFSVEVRDNVEITLATCDLETNHNMVAWLTTPAQAEYVSQVQIKRDGMVINTADYSAGTFIDNIGSDAASRTYTITAIGTDGVACPIESYPKETIHMAYLTGINNTIEVNWNTPTGYNLMGYNICEWHENDGSLNVIDYVGASVTSYTCQESLFDQGYIVVQGVENGKTESRLLSNRSIETVGIEENQNQTFRVYPNPTKGILFVETVCTPSLPVETYRIMNPIGQTVMQGEITSEKQQIDVRGLANGVYFITVGGATQKVVVK